MSAVEEETFVWVCIGKTGRNCCIVKVLFEMCINSGPTDERKVKNEREHVCGWCLRAKPQLVDVDVGMKERMKSRIVSDCWCFGLLPSHDVMICAGANPAFVYFP